MRRNGATSAPSAPAVDIGKVPPGPLAAAEARQEPTAKKAAAKKSAARRKAG